MKRYVYSFDVFPSGRTDGVNHDTLREARRAARGAYCGPGEMVRFFRDVVGGSFGDVGNGIEEITALGRKVWPGSRREEDDGNESVVVFRC